MAQQVQPQEGVWIVDAYCMVMEIARNNIVAIMAISVSY